MDGNRLEAMGCSSETVARATALFRQAKAKTGPGSGHALGPLSTSLVPICALLASEQLNNGEITQDVARAAACIEKAKFSKAVQIVRAALDVDTSSTTPISFAVLLERYLTHPMRKAQLEDYCNRVEREVKSLGIKASDPKTKNENTSAIFYWVCAAAKLDDLPEVQDFAQVHHVSANRISVLVTSFSKKLGPLRKQIVEETKTSAVRTPSPTKKTPATATPRRSGRQHREILTKESVKKRPAPSGAAEAPKPTERSGDDDPMSFPETPTKKRKVESSPSKSQSKTHFPVATASSSRVTLDADQDIPQTPRKPARMGSPLKQSVVLPTEDIDVRMEDPEVSDDEEERNTQSFRRFRPSYLEQKRWSARDPRLKRQFQVGEKRKLEYFQLYGNPFRTEKQGPG